MIDLNKILWHKEGGDVRTKIMGTVRTKITGTLMISAESWLDPDVPTWVEYEQVVKTGIRKALWHECYGEITQCIPEMYRWAVAGAQDFGERIKVQALFEKINKLLEPPTLVVNATPYESRNQKPIQTLDPETNHTK